MRRKFAFAAALLCAMLVLADISAGEVPQLINFQGRLTDAGGNPVNGQKTMEFQFFPVELNGEPLGPSQVEEVTVADGVFNVLLDASPIASHTGALYLAITVEGETLAPREQIVASAYALRADEADHADNAAGADYAATAYFADSAMFADDANSLGGVSASSFVRSDVPDTKTGDLTLENDLLMQGNTVHGVGAIMGADDGADLTFANGLQIQQSVDGGPFNYGGLWIRQFGSSNYGSLFVNDNGFHLGYNMSAEGAGLTINGHLVQTQELTAFDMDVTNDLTAFQAEVERGVAVATSDWGWLSVGTVEQGLENGDVGCRNLRADLGLYLGSSLGGGNIFCTDSNEHTVLRFDADQGMLALSNVLGTDTIELSGGTGHVSADGGIEGQGRNGLAFPSVDSVPGVRGIGTPGDIGIPGAVGVQAVGGGSILSDIAFRSYGRLQFLGHDEGGITLAPGDGYYGPALLVNRAPGTGAAEPLVLFNGDVQCGADLTVDGRFDAMGDAAVSGRLNVHGEMTVDERLDISANLRAMPGDGIELLTGSGQSWLIYGDSTMASTEMYIQGPMGGEIVIGSMQGSITLGSSTGDSLYIPSIIREGISVRDNAGGIDGATISAENDHGNGIAVFGTVESADACTVFVNQGTGDIIRGFSGDTGGNLVFQVTNSGRAMCTELEITGGADLAEPFHVNDAEEVKPGMVVSIDPDRTGQLRLSREAYDICVAGIVSGANGVKPGLTMRQTGTVADGSLPVALSGRVWCWCDAAGGAIRPGDMLTTADTPGHAMKVTDHDRARGAVLGKAMSPLPSGRGLVLVLVRPQ
ncbi:MAG: hypothetical protein HQ592_11475 [Planctomycetes bacterium]|nr:hypothetical protein [Planctomycetota bacterium]